MKGQVFTLKKMMRRAAILLLLSVFSALTARAERLPVGTVIATGTCGDNLTWTLTANGEGPYDSVHKTQCDGITMTISGTGAMADNSFISIFDQTLANNSGLTIDELLKRISNVIIEEGVTSIGNNAFSSFENMRRITLPSTLMSIGSQAFDQCDALKSVDIPDNVTSIGAGIFQECDNLRSVSLSAGIKTIPANTFKNCVRLMTLRLKRYVPDDANPITEFSGSYNFKDNVFTPDFSFNGCTALATLIVPKEGMGRYLYKNYPETEIITNWQIYPFLRVKNHTWTEANSNSNTCYDWIYFRYIIRPDCDILFEAGTTNRWTTWADKVNHAAPRGAEVYTIYNVGNGEVALNRITARVTLPETMRDGAGDDGMRDLVPAFVPVLIKRPAGTLTENLTMPFVMGGDPIFENGWYTSNSSPSIWVKDLPGSFDNDADGHGYVSTVFPDVMANAPYGYPSGLLYRILPFGQSPAGSARGLDDPDHDTGIIDVVEGITLDNSIFYGNADKCCRSQSSLDLIYLKTAYAFENDAFRPMTDEEKETGLASHQCALLVSERTTYPEQLTLSINERTEVTLADDADNTSAIEAAARQERTRVTLSGHTFYLDGDWNTLCLPFSINLLTEYKDRDHIFQFFGFNGYGTGSSDDAIVMELDTEGEYNGKKTGLDDGGTLNLYFKRADAIEAGKPYLVKWRFRNEYSISDPVFYDAKFVYVPPTPDLIINSVSDWNTFAQNVNNGTESYEGKLVRLDADLNGVEKMVGTSSNKFKGTFDGNGHTLGINLYGVSDCMAPFSYIEGATIKNLRTTGSVVPTSVYNHVSGLVGGGNNFTIENCWVSVAIKFDSNATNVYSGGIVGHSGSSPFTMTNCLFDGSIGYISSSSYPVNWNVGGLVGWGDDSTPNISNCLNDGTFAFSSILAMIARGNNAGTITNCYSTTNTSNNGQRYIDAGTYTTATGSDLLALLGDGWTMSGNKVVPIISTYDPSIGAPSDLHPITFPGGKFVGTYSPISYNSANSSILFLGAANTLYYPRTGTNISAFHAYFQFDSGNAVKEFKLNFDEEEDSADGIIAIDNGQLTIDNEDSTLHSPLSGWYDFSGRRLDGKPTQRGIYINNGKKVIIN